MFFSQQFCKVFTPNDAFIPCFLKRSESNNFLCDQIEEQVPIQVCKTIDKQRTPIVIGKGRWLETWSLKSIRFSAEHNVATNHLTWNQFDQRKKNRKLELEMKKIFSITLFDTISLETMFTDIFPSTRKVNSIKGIGVRAKVTMTKIYSYWNLAPLFFFIKLCFMFLLKK